MGADWWAQLAGDPSSSPPRPLYQPRQPRGARQRLGLDWGLGSPWPAPEAHQEEGLNSFASKVSGERFNGMGEGDGIEFLPHPHLSPKEASL